MKSGQFIIIYSTVPLNLFPVSLDVFVEQALAGDVPGSVAKNISMY